MAFDAASSGQFARPDRPASDCKDATHLVGRRGVVLGVGKGGVASQPAAHSPAGEGPGGRSQLPGIGGVDLTGQSLEQAGVVSEQPGLPGQHRDQVAAGDLTQHGQHLVADPVAAKAEIAVARVVDGNKTLCRAQGRRL
jgi:hypothetical protein